MYLENPDTKLLISFIQKNRPPSKDMVVILLGEKSRVEIPELIKQLNQLDCVFMGGIFPYVISEDNISNEGVVVKIIPKTKDWLIVGAKHPIPERFKEFGKTKCSDFSTAVILFDGYSPNTSDQLSTVHTYLGNSVQFIGGGTGYLDGRKAESLFCNLGCFNDATLICFSKEKVELGVKHGWKKKAGPFMVTNSHKNTLMELNWENPLHLYRNTLNKLGYKLSGEVDFFKEAHLFPFGIYKKGSEYIVRDPIKFTEQGYIECFGDIPPNTIIDLLHGDIESLTTAATNAAKQCLNSPRGGNQLLLFDCISRALLLNEKFKKELEGILMQIRQKQPELSLEGALSFGEVSSLGAGYLEILNKTVVLGLFY